MSGFGVVKNWWRRPGGLKNPPGAAVRLPAPPPIHAKVAAPKSQVGAAARAQKGEAVERPRQRAAAAVEVVQVNRIGNPAQIVGRGSVAEPSGSGQQRVARAGGDWWVRPRVKRRAAGAAATGGIVNAAVSAGLSIVGAAAANRIAAVIGAASVQVVAAGTGTRIGGTVLVNAAAAAGITVVSGVLANRIAAVSGAAALSAVGAAAANRIAAVSAAAAVSAVAAGTGTRASTGISVTAGTSAEANGAAVTPGIPGSSSSTSILLVMVISRGPCTFAETGAGTWNEIFDEQPGGGMSMAAYWAAGTETTAAEITPTGTANPIVALCCRCTGANTTTPIGTVGTGFGAASSDNTIGPIADPTPLSSSNGVVFCWGAQRATGGAPGTSEAISANSTGTWVEDAEHNTALGNDMSCAFYHNLFTTAPTLADETITVTGGTAAAAQCGKMLEIVAA